MMKNERLAIWMDHSHAVIMELTSGPIMQHTIFSEFTHEKRENSISKSEALMHNKEQHEQAEYFKKISEKIFNTGELLLFGPTDAKDELVNLLKTNHLFDKVKIEVRTVDVMSEIQMHAFVRDYFKHILE